MMKECAVDDGFVKLGQLKGEPRPRCHTEDGVIVCDKCGKTAVTIHFIPWVVTNGRAERRIKAACRKHPAGGYDIPIDELAAEMGGLLAHLSHKRERPHAQLIEWLDYDGGQALDRLRARGSK